MINRLTGKRIGLIPLNTVLKDSVTVFVIDPNKIYHGKASNLPHSDVEFPEIQRLLPHNWQLRNRSSSVLHEGQIAVHPYTPFWLHTQLV